MNNIWDFNKETAKAEDLNQNLIDLLKHIEKMPSGDLRLIMEVSTAQLAVSMGTMTRVDAVMNSLKGLIEEEKGQRDADL